MASKTAPPSGAAARPNHTLYCSNLPDKLQKDDLKRALYMLFSIHGSILDIVALKTTKMRGQAHVLFRDVSSSTQAMRSLQGFDFFGKEMVCLSRRDELATLHHTDPLLLENRLLGDQVRHACQTRWILQAATASRSTCCCADQQSAAIHLLRCPWSLYCPWCNRSFGSPTYTRVCSTCSGPVCRRKTTQRRK
jgi:hypothetical protein